MELATIIATTFVLILSFMIRSLDAYKFYAFGIDTFANLLYAKGRRSGSLNLFRAGKIVYPPFLPWLLSHLQNLLSVRKMHLVPKLFDLFTSIVVFLFTFWFSGSEFVALLALLIYTFSPINVLNGYGIGTRNIGSFFFVCTVLTSYVAMFDVQFRYVLFVLAIVTCLLMMLTSRIAYKSYFVLLTVNTVLLPFNMQNEVLLMVSMVSLVLCLLLTKGKFVDDVQGQIFLINFFRNRKEKEKSIQKRVTSIFYYNIWWCIGILAIINSANLFFSTWLCVIVVLSLLWPWGEGERHMLLGAAPASILASSYLTNQPLATIPLFLIEAAVIVRISIKLLQGKYFVSIDAHMICLFEEMKQIEGDSLFLCLPPIYSAPLAYFTEKKVLYGESSSKEGILFQADVLNAIKTQKDLEELASNYSVTHLFVDKDKFPLEIKPDYWEAINQDKRFAIYKKKNVQADKKQ